MGKLEFQGISKGADVQRTMKIARYADTIIPTRLPEFFKKFEHIVGDGGAGTTKLITLGPAITRDGPEVQMKEGVLVMDFYTGTIVVDVVDDPRYSKLVTTARVVLCGNGVDCFVNWEIDYEPCDPATPPPEDLKAGHMRMMELVQKYTDEHPEWPDCILSARSYCRGQGFSKINGSKCTYVAFEL